MSNTPLDKVDKILLGLDREYVLSLGEKNVSKYVWSCKIHRNLIEACVHKNIVGVQYFVDKSNDKDEALKYAVIYGHLEIVKYLIEKGADVDSNDGYALCQYAKNGDFDMIKYLIEHNANVNINNGYALWISAQNDRLDIIVYLVDNGANVHANEDEALYNSTLYGTLITVKYLVSKGANHDSALINAVMHKRLDIVRFLVEECGYDVHIYDDYALYIANRNASDNPNDRKWFDIIKYLYRK
jgi:ankyrin repeat protein